MPLNLPVFYKRLASSIVFAIIMLAGLLWNEWAFIALFAAVNFLCMHEYFRLMGAIGKQARWPRWLDAVMHTISLLFILLFSVKPNQVTDDLVWNIARALPVIPAVILLVSILSRRSSFSAWLQSLGGLFYITLPMILLIHMRMQDLAIPLALVLMIWTNDTFAYLVGSFFGKTPLSDISPHKTWEGTAGGALLTIIGAGIYGYFSSSYHWYDWVALAVCASVAGTFGDLMESKLKRMADVKDSGSLMPGHGGALDRFDSLLVAAPFAFMYVNYFMR